MMNQKLLENMRLEKSGSTDLKASDRYIDKTTPANCLPGACLMSITLGFKSLHIELGKSSQYN